MKINKILKLKNNKYKVVIDNDNITTYDDVILENGLLYKKDVDEFMYKKIIEDTNFYNIYNEVLKFVLKKIRCEKEVLKYLSKYNLKKDMQEKIINKLKSTCLIDNKKYAIAYINDKLTLSKLGVNKIRQELILNDIDINIINNELDNIDNKVEYTKLEKLIIKKINSNHKYSSNHLKQKILNDMTILGYSKNDILEILDENIKNDEDIIEDEYNKLYNKLKSKYNGVELNKKIRQNLFIKGFKIEDINLVMSKKTED